MLARCPVYRRDVRSRAKARPRRNEQSHRAPETRRSILTARSSWAATVFVQVCARLRPCVCESIFFQSSELLLLVCVLGAYYPTLMGWISLCLPSLSMLVMNVHPLQLQLCNMCEMMSIIPHMLYWRGCQIQDSSPPTYFTEFRLKGG